MKKIIVSFFTATALLAMGCNNDPVGSATDSATATKASSGKDFYFTFSVDGKEMEINPDDILTTYQSNTKGDVFKIFAGKDGETTVLLTIPADMSGPSTTPSGSPDFDRNITQGSVSLQNYPEKNYTTNSFNTTYPEMSVEVPDAVVITSSERDGDEGRVITGTFNAKTFATKDSDDPKDKDRQVKGKFRIRHEFNGTKF